MPTVKSAVILGLLKCNTEAAGGDWVLEKGVGLWKAEACMTTLPLE